MALFFISCNDGRKPDTGTTAAKSDFKEMIVEKNNDNLGADIVLNIEHADKRTS